MQLSAFSFQLLPIRSLNLHSCATEFSSVLCTYGHRLREDGVPDAERMASQDRANPKFVPRQHLLQVCSCATWSRY